MRCKDNEKPAIISIFAPKSILNREKDEENSIVFYVVSACDIIGTDQVFPSHR